MENIADVNTWILMGQVTMKLFYFWWPVPVAMAAYIMWERGGRANG